MTDPDPDVLTEAEAVRLWQRAAQLQAEAARKAEARSEASSARADEDGYALTHVRAAALEAGIAEEFVDAALADVRVERALPKPGRGGAFVQRVLDDPPEAITVRRVIDASPARVLAAMEEVLPAEPYNLVLADRRGDPLDGGVLIFDIQGAGFTVTQGFVGEASWADLRQVLVSIAPVPSPAGACEVTVRGPVAWAFTLNVAIGSVLVGMGGGLGLGIGSGLAAALGGLGLAAGLGTAAAVVAVMLATAGGARGGLAAFRALYHHALRKGERALNGLLSAVAVRAQGGWGLTPTDSERALRESDATALPPPAPSGSAG